jgi:hypothetical protein
MSALDKEAEFDGNYECSTVQVHRKRSLSVQFGDCEFDNALDAVLERNVNCLYDDACVVAAYTTDDSPARRKHCPRAKKPAKKGAIAEKRSLKSSREADAAPARRKNLVQSGPKLMPVAVAAAAATEAEAPPAQQLTTIHNTGCYTGSAKLLQLAQLRSSLTCPRKTLSCFRYWRLCAQTKTLTSAFALPSRVSRSSLL